MAEITTIPKKIDLPPAQDYEFLRKEGLKHIENLAHDVWTDYNSHDPGITILELLCYAITELGYRSDFPMKDLVVTEGSGISDRDRIFYTAKEILTNNPLTIDDYRKFLVDIDGIQNAWLIAEDKTVDGKKFSPVNEVPIYADFKADMLTYDETPSVLFLSGLYRVLLELEYDDNFGDLNNGDIIKSNPALPNRFEEGEFLLKFELLSWANGDFDFAAKAADKNTEHISSITIASDGEGWKCKITLDDASGMEFGITVPIKPSSQKITDADITSMLTKGFLHGMFETYLAKIEKARKIVRTAVKELHGKRNLCEDFLSVTTIEAEEISFCFDIDVQPSADIEKVEAEVFYAIENYLSPRIQFYSLRELLDKKITVDEIFQGPILSHGFIDTDQLEQTNLRTVIHSSDIINLLMDIEGVLAIRNFVMTKFGDDGKPIPGCIGLDWCMHISPWHKPVLAKEKSKILLFKNQFPFLARYDEVRDTILLLHAQRSRNKLNGFQQDLPIPAGRKRDTESFWPIQYDLPQTYGVGEAGLPSDVSLERRMQQKQLKGYLMFYEQLLADFFSQLTNAIGLFSIADLDHTYHAQFLKNIKDIDPIYAKNGIPILQALIQNADSTDPDRNPWQAVYESRQVFEDRRGRFLDHLLARFAESFNDYALMMYRINYEDRTEEKLTFEELSASKIETLREYPETSRSRANGFNYYPQHDDFSIDTSGLWDTENVSGLEKRICALTGISDETRRFLYCIKNIEIICVEKIIDDQPKCFHEFSVTSVSGSVLRNSQVYESKAKAGEAVVKLIALGVDKNNYRFDETHKRLLLKDGDADLMQSGDNSFNTQNLSMAAADEFVEEFKTPCNDPVGLHLIEHILLRPRDKTFNLMQVCLHNGECFCEIDPYSFRASVVLPYWPGHFDNMAFREYFEMKIQEEAPAHVMLKVCWLSNELMREFELAYKAWTELLAKYAEDHVANIGQFKIANDNMLEVLGKLHSEYPLATLHDCDESKEGSNTVVLGKTVLGTFKNK